MSVGIRAKIIYGYPIPKDFKIKNVDPDVLEVYDDEDSPIHFIYDTYPFDDTPIFFGMEVGETGGHQGYVRFSLKQHVDICTGNSTKVQTAFEDVLQRTINKLPSIMIVSMYD